MCDTAVLGILWLLSSAAPPARPEISVTDPPRVRVSPVLTKLRVGKVDAVTFPNGVRLRLVAHGHKRTRVGGPSSPLLVSLAFSENFPAEMTNVEFSLHLEEERHFAIGRHLFRLAAHHYGEWMDLEYFGAIEQTPEAR